MMTGKIIISAVLLLALALTPIATAQVPAWSIETVDSAGAVGYDKSIALDSAGNPHIGYFDFTNADLKYARWTGSAWSIATVDSAGAVGYDTSIALDSAGNPHISYFDLTNNDLKYARWTGSAWSIATVDSAGNVGYDTSIALDSAGNPHISYRDATNADLKYARWTGSAWSIAIVDSAGNVGYETSIALDSAGNPHISYSDATNTDLKYAFILGTPTIVTLQGKLTDSTTGSPVQTGSMQVTIKSNTGMQVWQNTFGDVLYDGVFNIPLGAVQELRLIPDLIYQMEVEIDADSATFVTADVTLGDGSPSEDVIKFNA